MLSGNKAYYKFLNEMYLEVDAGISYPNFFKASDTSFHLFFAITSMMVLPRLFFNVKLNFLPLSFPLNDKKLENYEN